MAAPGEPLPDRWSTVARWSCVGVIGVVPLAVDPGALTWALLPKLVLLGLLVPGGLAATLAGGGRLRWPARGPWAAWLLVLTTAAAMGVAPVVSLLGSPQREAGVLAWLLSFGSFVLGASLGHRPEVVRSVARAAVVGVALAALVAVLEALDVDVLAIGDLSRTSRVRSTWGNATFLGAHLVLLGPLVAIQTRSTSREWRTAARAATAVGAVALVLTQSRGAWVGAAVAASVVGWPALRERRGQVALGALAVAIVVGVGVAVASPVIVRDSATGRLDLWAVAVRAVGDRPLLGSGPDTQRIALPASIDDGFEARHQSDELHDRAHSLPLDTAVTTGLVGAVALGALVAAIGRAGRRAVSRGRIHRALAAGAAGYLVHLLVAFGDASLDPLAWLVVGLLLALPADAGEPAPAHARRGRAIGTAALFVAAVTTTTWFAVDLAADRALATANERAADGRLVEATAALTGVADAPPHRYDVDQARARIAERRMAAGDPGASRAVGDALERLTGAPDDPEVQVDRASLLTTLGRHDEAERTYRRVLEVTAPSSWRAHLGLGVVAAERGEVDAAERWWIETTHLAPRRPEAWANLARIYRASGRAEEAARAEARAADLSVTTGP